MHQKIDIFKDQVKMRRREMGLTQRQLARKIGIDSRTINGYELGKRQPVVSTLLILCEVLRCTPNDLLGY